jgi:hypothetical protein
MPKKVCLHSFLLVLNLQRVVMFRDTAKVHFKGGHGGAGIASFERFVLIFLILLAFFYLFYLFLDFYLRRKPFLRNGSVELIL